MSKGGNDIRVTPTVRTSAYANNDVLFNPVEIPNAVATRGGVSILRSFSIIDLSANTLDSGSTGAHDFELFFHSTGGIDLGTINAQPDITDANWVNLNLLGWRKVSSADWVSNNSSSDSASHLYTNTSTDNDPAQPMLLKANDSSTSVFVSAINGNDAIIYGDSKDLRLIIHVEYL